MAELTVSADPQTKYQTFVETQRIVAAPGPFISRDDAVFTIGSCFAREIRFALRDIGLRVTPRYRDLRFDPAVARVDNLPDEEHLNYYNAFTIRQEIERAVGLWSQEEDDYWTVSSRVWKGHQAFQDPYRRLVFGRTAEALRSVTEDASRIMREALLSADAFLITYGMTEVFRNKRNGRIVAQKPLYGGGGGATETEFWQSGFDDNLQAVRATVRAINAHRPGAKIFMTVSPVALERTFSTSDIYVANSESKAILRAVLGQVSREFPSVTYFPAYEAVMSNGPASFRPDGRHVLVDTVQSIMRAFVQAHVEGDVPGIRAPSRVSEKSQGVGKHQSETTKR
jgi:hypothetical protein